MILSAQPHRGGMLNPWSGTRDASLHWGPVAVQDPSQGLLVQLWELTADGTDAVLKAPAVAASVIFTHTSDLIEVSLAFDQNARPVVAFVDAMGDAWLWWFDPQPNQVVFAPLAADTVNPRVTLDDARPANLTNSDVILAYIRAGTLRHRRQRDRFQDEYTPTQGPSGPTYSAQGLHHLSMNSVWRLQFMFPGSGQEDWMLAEVIEELAARAGLPASKLGLHEQLHSQIVRGFAVNNGYPCYGAMQALSQVFFFDPSNADGKVRFVPRGADAVTTITEAEFIDDDEDIEVDSKRGDPISIPRVLHLNYWDIAGGLATDKQRSERPEGTRAEGEQSLQSAVLMTADEAATVVAIQHGVMAELQKGELNFSLGDNRIGLTESDPLFVQYEGRTVRAMLIKVDTDVGQQRYRAVHDRQSLYTLSVQGFPAAPITPPPSQVVGPTLLELVDTQILRDADDRLGWYMAATGIYPAWIGAQVDLSLDGGASYVDSQTTTRDTVMGSTVSALGAHPVEFPDTVHTVQVSVSTPNAGLESITMAGLQNGGNLAMIGDEMIQFGDAIEVSPGTWELSTLIRGRKGTAAGAHGIGERFVLLTPGNVLFVPAELSMLNRSLTFRATSLGTSTAEATLLTVIYTGQSQTERAPAYLQARRSGSDLVASWQGVGRLGSGAHVALGAYFAGYRVTLTDGSTTQTFDQVGQSITTSLAAFTGPVNVSVQQRNQLTGLGPAIEAII